MNVLFHKHETKRSCQWNKVFSLMKQSVSYLRNKMFLPMKPIKQKDDCLKAVATRQRKIARSC